MNSYNSYLLFPSLLYTHSITLKSFKMCEDCPICKESMNKIFQQTLNCGHKFHHKCIWKWAKIDIQKVSCPLCRKENVINPRIEFKLFGYTFGMYHFLYNEYN